MRDLKHFYVRAEYVPQMLTDALIDPFHNAEKLQETLAPLTSQGFYKNNFRDLCGFDEYTVIVYLKEDKVNRKFIENNFGTYAADELTKRSQFPYHVSICTKGKDKTLYLCVSYEPYSPNWNNEQKLIGNAIPLTKIFPPLITSAADIEKMDENVYEFLKRQSMPKVDFPDYGKQPTKAQLAELIKMGMPCKYRHGWAYRGARARDITKEEALKKLPNFSYGMGFYMLDYSIKDGIPELEFNELGENDLL